MSGKEYFVRRYKELGWTFNEFESKQSIRINAMNTKKTDVAKRLKSLGIMLEKISFLQNGYWVWKSEFSVGATSEYLLGLYSIQEAAAQIPATLFNDLENKTVLDACAAPGGKTVQLADLMQNTGAIIALDVRRRRLVALTNQLERCHVKNTIVYHMDARESSLLNMRFDRILLDVPCSGNYTTDKNWFSKRTIKDVEKNAELQRQILAATIHVAKDDAELVYATCSLEPEENELNIDWAIKTLNLEVQEVNCYGERALTNVFGRELDSSIKNCRRIWPEQTQGFFFCKLKKRACAQ